MSNTNRRKLKGSSSAIIATVISALLALLILVNRQYIIDQVTVWQYQPSADIVSFADRSGMNDSGKFYFYASQPSLEKTQVFNDKCGRKEQSTAVLGCYTSRTIYIYDITDAKLDCMREVTAAHEMLHAAYDRLSDGERQKINKLVEDEYLKLKTDAAFAERIAFYERTEPGERDNELHSLIGTEVESISSVLEKHYKNYFADRHKVVALHGKYAAVFNDLQVRGRQLSDQMVQLGDTIEHSSASYNKDVTQLNDDIKAFNAKADSSGFATVSQFQYERAALVTRASQLDARRSAVNDDVARYNALRDELKGIAVQSEALSRSIDSTLAPAPSI